MGDTFFLSFSLVESAPVQVATGAAVHSHTPQKPHTYLLYMGHDPSLGFNVQLFDPFDKFLFPLTLWKVAGINRSTTRGQPMAPSPKYSLKMNCPSHPLTWLYFLS